MKIDIKCELPFDWCGECQALDLETVDSYYEVTGPERSYLCRHADSCECGEAAARRWREAMIEITSADPSKRRDLAELIQKSCTFGPGVQIAVQEPKKRDIVKP